MYTKQFSDAFDKFSKINAKDAFIRSMKKEIPINEDEEARNKKYYDVQDVIDAECMLEPLKCRACGKIGEVTFNQEIGDAQCGHCGEWQLNHKKPTNEEKSNKLPEEPITGLKQPTDKELDQLDRPAPEESEYNKLESKIKTEQLIICEKCNKTSRTDEKKCKHCGSNKITEVVATAEPAVFDPAITVIQNELFKLIISGEALSSQIDDIDKISEDIFYHIKNEDPEKLEDLTALKGNKELILSSLKFVLDHKSEEEFESKKVKEGISEKLYDDALQYAKFQMSKAAYDPNALRDNIIEEYKIKKEEAEDIILDAAEQLDLGDIPIFKNKLHCVRCGYETDHLYAGKYCEKCARSIDRINREFDQDLTGQDEETYNESKFFILESKAINSLYKKAKLTPPIGKGEHTTAFHRMAIAIAKGMIEKGKSEKAALQAAYPIAMKKLGRDKAVNKSHRKKNESVSDVNDYSTNDDFEKFLITIDQIKQAQLETELFGDNEYIDTPGNYWEEYSDYDNVFEYYERNMGNDEVLRLFHWYLSNKEKADEFVKAHPAKALESKNEFKLLEKIVKKKDGYYVQSSKGKNLGGPYKTEEKAKKRLKQVEFFKHKKKNESINEYKQIDDGFPIYIYDSKQYLELHDNRTWWDIENNISVDNYNDLVEGALFKFKKQTGIELLLLGRSGRHVCVEDTPENRKNYEKLKKLAIELEKDIIDIANNLKNESIKENNDPFAGNVQPFKSDTELANAIRLNIKLEQDAISTYRAHAGATTNESAKKLFLDLAEEEVVHVGELTKLLETIQPEDAALLDQGEKEASDKIGEAKINELATPADKVELVKNYIADHPSVELYEIVDGLTNEVSPKDLIDILDKLRDDGIVAFIDEKYIIKESSDDDYNKAIDVMLECLENWYSNTDSIIVDKNETKVIKQMNLNFVAQDLIDYIRENKPELLDNLEALCDSVFDNPILNDFCKYKNYEIMDKFDAIDKYGEGILESLKEADENYTVIAKGLTEEDADKIAQEKKGTVSTDENDKTKFMVIVKK